MRHCTRLTAGAASRWGDMKKRKLGELLIERGSISYEHLTWALNEQRGKEILLGELLLSRGLLTKESLGEILAEVLHVEFVNVRAAIPDVDVEVLKLVPRAVAE